MSKILALSNLFFLRKKITRCQTQLEEKSLQKSNQE
jgi:hypothetical protein